LTEGTALFVFQDKLVALVVFVAVDGDVEASPRKGFSVTFFDSVADEVVDVTSS